MTSHSHTRLVALLLAFALALAGAIATVALAYGSSPSTPDELQPSERQNPARHVAG
jgi:Flp pilus assembly protein CpaB